MKESMRTVRRLIIICAAFSAVMVLPLLSSARATNQLTIVNNSNRVILDVYLTSVGSELWSDDQLGEQDIAPGQSFTLSNFACPQQQIKVIGEDGNGCFLSVVIACGDSSATWTITNDTPADCGQ